MACSEATSSGVSSGSVTGCCVLWSNPKISCSSGVRACWDSRHGTRMRTAGASPNPFSQPPGRSVEGPEKCPPAWGTVWSQPHSQVSQHSPWALPQPQVKAGRIPSTSEKWFPSCQAVQTRGHHTRSMGQEFQPTQCHVPPKHKWTFGQMSVSDRFVGYGSGLLPAAKPHRNLHSKPNTSLFCNKCSQACRTWQTNPLCLSTCGQWTLQCAWP